MDRFLYWIIRPLIAVLQSLPLAVVARLGRAGGQVAYWVDVRHRRVARENLRHAFAGEKTLREIRALAVENFRRIGEAFACAAKTSGMSQATLSKVVTCTGQENLGPWIDGQLPLNRVFATGHFGNFEILTAQPDLYQGYRIATTYRALPQPSLNRLLLDLRTRSGCLCFERRSEARALQAALRQGGIALGLLADQRTGGSGVSGPFFGRDCSTSPAPAIYALRYRSALHTLLVFRTAPGRWQIEIGPAIPTHLADGQTRPVADIVRDMNQQFEAAVRRDPANWFWVHNRWKTRRTPRTRRAPPRTLTPPD